MADLRATRSTTGKNQSGLDPVEAGRGRTRRVVRAIAGLALGLPIAASFDVVTAGGPESPGGDVVVVVANVRNDAGGLACALFSSPDGFPMRTAGARTVWEPARAGRGECRFTDVQPGVYAIAVVHDENANRRMDANFLGIPTEGWAVSGNVRHALRAPRFEEARFRVGTAPVRFELDLAY